MNNISINPNQHNNVQQTQGLGLDNNLNPVNKIETIKPADLRAAALLDRDTTDDVQRIPLSQIVLAQRAANSAKTSRKRPGATDEPTESHEESGSDDGLKAESLRVVEDLRDTDGSETADRLSNKYDALEEHTLLKDAMSRLNEMELPPEERDALREQLQSMIDGLQDSDGDAIQEGVANQQAYEKTLAAMGTLASPGTPLDENASLSDLRAMYCNKEDGNDVPLTPLALARTLQDKFGADNFSAAMGDLRSKMATTLRNCPPTGLGPQMWLSFGDASCFNMLQTGFSLAGDMRRELWDQAGVLSRSGQTALAIQLLSWAESGEERAEVLGEGVADLEELDPLQSALMYMTLYRTVSRMPMSLWSLELLRKRMALLQNLKSKIASQKLPSARRDEAEELEEQLRAKSRREGRRGDGGDGGDGDEGDEQDKAQQEEKPKKRRKARHIWDRDYREGEA